MAVTVHRAVPADQVAEAGPVVITERIYWDVTKTRLLAEGHPDARFLAYVEGTTLPAELAGQIAGVERATVAVPVEPAPEKPRRGRPPRQDRQAAPGVVADTSIDGEAHVLAPEPGSPLRNGVDK